MFIRAFAANYCEPLKKIEELQKLNFEQNKNIENIYRIIEEPIKPEVTKPKRKIGF